MLSIVGMRWSRHIHNDLLESCSIALLEGDLQFELLLGRGDALKLPSWNRVSGRKCDAGTLSIPSGTPWSFSNTSARLCPANKAPARSERRRAITTTNKET